MRASASMASLATPRLMLRRILEVPTAYAILAPMLMLLGAATTIIAPIILNPAQFIDFSLAMAVFQYLCYFDFGMARLTDRHFSQPNSSAALYRDLTVTRLILAGILLIGLLCLSPLIGTLFTLAGIGGVFFMLTLGQMAYHRARSNIYAFTLTALLIQIGMSIPRLSGLLINGVAGCVLVLALWYGLVALLLSVFDFGSSTWMPSIVSSARLLSIRALRQIGAASLPLFIYDNFWTFYVLAPRWIAATLTEASDAGRFAFGANLIWIGSGVFGTIAQVYYPRHLANRDHSALLREMIIVFGLASMGVMIAIPLCRYGMAFVFPRFAGAQAATAATLISAIPIVLISWGLPLIIAFSHRPIWESFISFGGSIIGLLLFMWLGDRIDGIVGQAFGLVVSAILLFGIMMGLLYRHAMMPRAASLLFFAGSASAIGFCTIEWWMVFYG